MFSEINGLTDYLQIRYIKLHFTLQILADGYLPSNKASALRGGMGRALMLTNCIGDENCADCGFREDCLVRRMMYPEMKIRPDFMKTQDSEGFIVECENHDEWFRQGDELSFNLLLFGRCIVYFTQYLQAFYNLGGMGLGKEHIPFHIVSVTNTTGDPLVRGMNVYKEQFKVATVEEYVRYRLTSSELHHIAEEPAVFRLLFHTPLSMKHGGQMQKVFSPEAVLTAVERRLFILNCFEGRKENEDYVRIPLSDHFPSLLDQYVFNEKVKRYSGTQHSHMYFSGIRGWCDLAGTDATALILLLAGELIHIGKNTSFGFGRYTLIVNDE